MPSERRFGFLPEGKAYTVSTYSIEPLAGIAAAVEEVRASGRVSQGWYYPPLEPVPLHPSSNGEPPLAEALGFWLPDTHRLMNSAPANEHLDFFLIQVLGFVKGLKLIPDEWQHLHRVPVILGRLVDFLASKERTEEVLLRAHEMWLVNEPLRRPLFGALHWYLFSQSYRHDFEVFNAQYIVLDTCWHIHELLTGAQRTSHTRRPLELCATYGLSVPPWLDDSAGQSALAKIRNSLVHEGLFGGEPLSFGASPTVHDDIDEDLTEFNARLLLALLGLKHSYIATAVGSKEVHFLA